MNKIERTDRAWKRVWCLYRVSGKKQVSIDDDIPMQRAACHNYVKDKKDWKITNELYEKGVSGWKKTTEKRDELMTIKEAAINKEFDILLVFLLDRLGRREDESPLVVNFLYEHGIEVWSVQNGKRSVETHSDKLMTYIDFWQSSGESLKTSQRVRESKKQWAEQGYYQGGVPPYGYKIIETDQKHWKVKDRFLKELIPDEYESEIVKIVFDLYVNKLIGYRKIVDYLNLNYIGRNNKPFRVNTIQRILTNPICIGYKNYESFDKEITSLPYNEKLVIIPEELFYKAQEIREMKQTKDQNKTNIPMTGKLMFSGLAYCGYCGSKLSGNYLYRTCNVGKYSYKTAIYRYRCPLNKGKVAIPHGKNIWGSKKFDQACIEKIKLIMKSINIVDYIDTSLKNKNSESKIKKDSLAILIKEKKKIDLQIDKLNNEIINSLSGDSHFTPEQLSLAISSSQNKLDAINVQIKDLEQDINYMEKKQNTIIDMSKEIENWERKFDDADDELKKAMLFRIIDKVLFYDDSVDIRFNGNIESIIQNTSLS